MRVTVLGNPDRYLAPLSGGTGYLLEAGDARVLLDCGPGVRAALESVDVSTLDAVVVSHFHYDHALDLVPIVKELPKGCAVFAPQGARGNLAAIARAYGFEGAFETPGKFVEGRPGDVHSIKRLRLDFAPGAHSAPSIATRARAGGRIFVYASDSAPSAPLAELSRKADVLLAHALMPTVEADAKHAKIHMTAESAGAFAAEAQVRKLILSHRYWESKDEDMLAAAKNSFDNVHLAEPGKTYGPT